MEQFLTWYLGRIPRWNPSGSPFGIGLFVRRGFVVVPMVTLFWMTLNRAGVPSWAVLGVGLVAFLPLAIALARKVRDGRLVWSSLKGLGILVLSTGGYFQVGGVVWLLIMGVVWATVGVVTDVWWVP